MIANFMMRPNATYGKVKYIFIFTKFLIMPLIGAIYYFGTKKVAFSVMLYVFGHWFGDLILLSDSNLAVNLGGLSFTIGHFAIIHAFHVDWAHYPIGALVLAFPFIAAQQYKIIKNANFKTVFGWCLFTYCCFLDYALLGVSGRVGQLGFSNKSFLLGYFGYISFMTSDFILISTILGIAKGLCRIEILGTYMLAQLLLGNAILAQNYY
ncbi:hypothetical protein TVAG_112800 [Trichomonas vaginalis G3]|uniref:YhhN-like protein n=1 Tax=Trichomonas vaginalis (strain ATCC PRA-98 / G3) TaxID=412133 RepID=A2F727_TRIV3|nr:YhhN family [Trichomonas vaginalis G3]EAX99264.1 hypothetical protein TVAG_112800 [Trichomonas vaginalis G3]KAI5524930.1 YhhN family [Trichomonas vaginalis G3]|eukprot:XP_001312194.1 hypothetical protein [Trichomonas vaginalis G3]